MVAEPGRVHSMEQYLSATALSNQKRLKIGQVVMTASIGDVIKSMLLQLPPEVMPALKAKLSQPLRVGTLVAPVQQCCADLTFWLAALALTVLGSPCSDFS